MDSRTYMPKNVAHPGEIVLDYLDAYGWSQRDLSRRTGLTTKNISEICNGKAPISPITSLALEKVLGRPAHFWNNLQTRYEETKARNFEAARSADWWQWVKNFPLKDMKARGWIHFDETSKESSTSELLHFLGVSSPDSWRSVWNSYEVTYRQTRAFSTNDFAIAAWVRATELEAREVDTEIYNEKLLIKSINELRSCTRLSIDEGLESVQSILAKCGVAFVCVPALPKTGISGCSRWLNNKKPVIALSLRYTFDDQIWFTFFHELGHILKHRKTQSFIVDNAEDFLTDNTVDPNMQRLEDEANRFASDTLIPAEILSKYISFGVFNNDSIHEFSEAIGVSTGIVVGRLQHEGFLKPYQGNSLKQQAKWSLKSEGE